MHACMCGCKCVCQCVCVNVNACTCMYHMLEVAVNWIGKVEPILPIKMMAFKAKIAVTHQKMDFCISLA